MAKPMIVEAPPNDPELGTVPDLPAKSCIDILKNGGPAKSGIYWI